MKGLTKIRGIGTEEIVAFLKEHSIPHKIEQCSVGIDPRDGYSGNLSPCAFKSRITLHTDNRDLLRYHFPSLSESYHYDYRAFYKVDSPEFLNNISGLVEVIDGLIVVDTRILGWVGFQK